MNYLAFHFVVEPPQPGSEILIACIQDLGFDSFDIHESGFTAYKPDDGITQLNLGFIEPEGFVYSYKVEHIEGTNWNAEWEKNFEPVIVDELLCIRAPFHEPNIKVKHEIVIMPKMSFGTGHHQTTRLMCRTMSELQFKAGRVLDMGTGTGILAIFAKQLGATEVIGIDIDEWSVENASENCRANHFNDITIKKGDIEDVEREKQFDFILANINKNILKKHLPVYAAKLKSGAKLLLSGFFTTDVKDLEDLSLTLDVKLLSSRQENEWAMMLLEKK